MTGSRPAARQRAPFRCGRSWALSHAARRPRQVAECWQHALVAAACRDNFALLAGHLPYDDPPPQPPPPPQEDPPLHDDEDEQPDPDEHDDEWWPPEWPELPPPESP